MNETEAKPTFNNDAVWARIIGSVIFIVAIPFFWFNGAERFGALEGWFPYVFWIAVVVCAFNVMVLYHRSRPTGSPRLGVGVRIGIVLTAFWMVIGSFGLWVLVMSMSYSDPYEVERSCRHFMEKTDLPAEAVDRECVGQREERTASNRRQRISIGQEAMMMAAILAAIAWALATLIYGCVRWIIAGRTRRE